MFSQRLPTIPSNSPDFTRSYKACSSFVMMKTSVSYSSTSYYKNSTENRKSKLAKRSDRVNDWWDYLEHGFWETRRAVRREIINITCVYQPERRMERTYIVISIPRRTTKLISAVERKTNRSIPAGTSHQRQDSACRNGAVCRYGRSNRAPEKVYLC